MSRRLFFEQAPRWAADFATRRAAFSYLAKLVLLAAVYSSAAKLSLMLAIPPGYATAVWPPSGIAVASVMLLGSRIWPGIWLGALLVNLSVQASFPAAAVMGAGNALEALATAALAHAWIGTSGAFRRGEDVIKFAMIAVASATIAASVAAVTLALVHSLGSPELLWNWWTWWQGDTVGILVVAPLILAWAAGPGASPAPRTAAEAGVFACLLAGAMYAIFGGGAAPYLLSPALTFAILPFIIWAAFRFPQRELATVNALVCAAAVWFTLAGSGPFTLGSLNESLLLLLAFMGTVTTTGLVLSAVVDDRRRLLDAMQRVMRDLREQTLRDPLTSLYNRRFLHDHLERELIRAARGPEPLAVIMIDLDYFKRLNDRAGHLVGDRVLAEIGALLKRHVRGSDIACRYGGEEFVLVLAGATLDDARHRAEQICSAIGSEQVRFGGVTASLGIALYPEHAVDTEALLRAADQALYEAKAAGRNRVQVFVRPAGRAES